jgi:hypothetical protein
MRIISSKIHAALDYSIAAILAMLPWFMDYEQVIIARNLSLVTAIVITLISILTDYIFGIFKVIGYSLHLGLDIAVAIFLIASPLLFNIRYENYFPLVMIGEAMLIIVALSSEKLLKPSGRKEKFRMEKHNPA